MNTQLWDRSAADDKSKWPAIQETLHNMAVESLTKAVMMTL